jgi:sugar-specific transcriptional regulator TrmB
MPNNNILIKSLKMLGLSDQAISLYEVLINSGFQSISKLSSLLGLPRLQIYKYLDELAQKDLVIKEPGKTKVFEVASPEKLQTKLKIQSSQMAYLAQDLDQTIKQFELIKSQNSRKNLLVIGEQKFKNLYLELNQKAETEVLFLGNADSLEQFLEDNYINFAITNRVKKILCIEFYAVIRL